MNKRLCILTTFLFLFVCNIKATISLVESIDSITIIRMQQLYENCDYELCAKTVFEYYNNKNNPQNHFVVGQISANEIMYFYWGVACLIKMEEQCWNSDLTQVENSIFYLNEGKKYNGNCRKFAFGHAAFLISKLCFQYAFDVAINYFDGITNSLADRNSNEDLCIERCHRWITVASTFYISIENFQKTYCRKNIPPIMYRELAGIENDYGTEYLLWLVDADMKDKKLEKMYKKLIAIKDKFYSDYLNDRFPLQPVSMLYEIERLSRGNYRKSFRYLFDICLPKCQEYLELIDTVTGYDALKRISGVANIWVANFEKCNDKNISDACNLAIGINNLRLYLLTTNGKRRYDNLRNTRWTDIQKYLKDGECCLQLFEAPVGSDRHLFGYAFDNKSVVPQVMWHGHSYSATYDTFREFMLDNLKKEFPSMRRLYYVGIPDMAWAVPEGSNIMIHRLYSLAELDLQRQENIKVDSVVVLAGLDYLASEEREILTKGLSDVLGNFKSDATHTQFLIDLFPGPVKVLTGKKVDYAAFKAATHKKRINILHVSTHCIYDEKSESTLNRLYPDGIITGENKLLSTHLALSGYNENDDGGHFVDAGRISALYLEDVDLVVLSTCNSGRGKISNLGVSSVADAFHLAGVKYVIAIIGSVYETDADEFTRKFYKSLASGETVHNAFYKTKITLNREVFMVDPPSRSDIETSNKIKVVLWE